MMAMNVLYIMLSSWGRAIYEVTRSAQRTQRWVLIFTTSLFNAGPWSLVIAVAFGIYVHALPWALWFFGGAVAWFLFLGAFASHFVWKQRRRQKSLVIAVAFGIYVHALPWALWFFGGAVAWFLFFGAFASHFVWKQIRPQKRQTQ